MFQYPSSYISPSMTYAFLPSMGYQVCYLSQDRLLVLPQNYFPSPCDSFQKIASEHDDNLISEPLVVEPPTVEKKIVSR